MWQGALISLPWGEAVRAHILTGKKTSSLAELPSTGAAAEVVTHTRTYICEIVRNSTETQGCLM